MDCCAILSLRVDAFLFSELGRRLRSESSKGVVSETIAWPLPFSRLDIDWSILGREEARLDIRRRARLARDCLRSWL